MVRFRRGYRRRTGLADALLHDPKLLLLDDPLANVDAIECERIAACITHAARHAAVLVSGHALAQLGALCTRFLVLRSGGVAADIAREDLMVGHRGGLLEARLADLVAGRDAAAVAHAATKGGA